MSLFVNNGVLVHSVTPPPFSTYTNAALGRFHTNYVAPLWADVGQPCKIAQF